MCYAKADGGKRCTCPPEQRRATSRAKYAAAKLASPVENAPLPAGQLTDEEMAETYSHQLRMQADAWADRDPEYARRLRTTAEARHVIEALSDDSYDPKSLTGLWAVDRDWTQFKVARTVTDADGNPVEWDKDGWQQMDFSTVQTSEDGKTWNNTGEGVLHHPEDDKYLVYRWRDENNGRKAFVEARVADDLTAAAEMLTDPERERLGFPATRPAPLETRETSRTEQSEVMKDLRRELVGDNAKPDAALEFAAQMQAMRLEAVARGAATDHKWSMANRALTQAQANLRGAKIAGWMGGERQWEAQGRVAREGAEPYEIWAPVIKGAKSDDEDEVATRRAGKSDDDTPSGRSFTKKTADGKTLVGFRVVKVYDWTQTRRADGQPDPDWSPTIPGGDKALLERMKASSPLPVVEDHTGDLTGHSHGWTDNRKIVLDPNRSYGSQISTMAHEMGHVELDHIGKIARGEITRAEAEQEAQLVAYQVMRSLNLGGDTDKATTEATASYLNSWAKADGTKVAGHKQRWKMLQDRIAPASDAAHTILTRLLALDGSQPSTVGQGRGRAQAA